MTGPQNSRTPTLSEVLRGAIGQALAHARVCMPGQVQSYDAATQTASVKPSVKSSYAADGGEVVVDLPVLVDVPVCFPRAGAWAMTFPLAPGDHVVLVFTDRSLDKFRSLGGVQDPQDLRTHDLSDAVAIPASLVPDSAVLAGVADHLVLRGPVGSIHLKSDGSIALGTETPTDSAATALKVQAQLASLAAVLASLNATLTLLATAHTALAILEPVSQGVAATGCTATATTLTSMLSTPWPASVASSVVKVSP